jgi:hypothetical protein
MGKLNCYWEKNTHWNGSSKMKFYSNNVLIKVLLISCLECYEKKSIHFYVGKYSILYIKATCLSVCLSVRAVSRHCPDPFFFFFFFFWWVLFFVSIKLPGPFFFFFFFYGFCFLWQLLLDRCIMHQVHTSYFKWAMLWGKFEVMESSSCLGIFLHICERYAWGYFTGKWFHMFWGIYQNN